MKDTVKTCRFPNQTTTILTISYLTQGNKKFFVHKMNKINPGTPDVKEVRDNIRNKRKLSDTTTE